MINIQLLDVTVLEKFERAFPGEGRARRALGNYLEALAAEIEVGLQQGYVGNLKFFRIRLTKLTHRGPKIGNQRKGAAVSVHKWLQDNSVPLIAIIEKGTNLSRSYSMVQATKRIRITEQPGQIRSVTLSMLDPGKARGRADRVYLAPEMLSVDMARLKNYVEGMVADPRDDYAHKVRLRSARLILQQATTHGGTIPMRPFRSKFGRIYYEGESVQSVHKGLRWAMLGDCWEYDLRSAAAAWKFGFARDYLKSINCDGEPSDVFPSLFYHLEDKPLWMEQAASQVFGNSSKTTLATLKRGLQAVGFGARLHAGAYMLRKHDGQYKKQETALLSVFGTKQAVGRFLGSSLVDAYVKEHRILDAYIFNDASSKDPDLLKLEYLKTKKGRLSRNKVLAYLFQHMEAEVMDRVCAVISECSDGNVVAKIHDCVITREPLGEIKERAERAVQEWTGNIYWRLGETHHS
jgi:hypothetical protein